MDENALMQKLAISKAIMDKHNTIKRGSLDESSYPTETNINMVSAPEVQTFNTPNINYNIPQEYGEQQKTTKAPVVTEELVLKSKLPEEIKRLMIENPIQQVNPMMGSGPVLSDELVEKATKLMNRNNPTKPQIQESQKQVIQTNDTGQLRNMLKEVVKEVLKENGLLIESVNKTNETMVIRVGQHIFEGKISKIKKVK